MKKADYTIRLVLRPSQLDPDRAAVQITLRLSDGRRMYFTAKGSVDTAIAENEFDTMGRPNNPERYDKRTWLFLRGFYSLIENAINKTLRNTALEDVTRSIVKSNM